MNFKIVAGILSVILLGTGLATTFVPRLSVDRTEEWMETQIPERFEGYGFQGSTNPKQSYKMDPLTYETLKPYGIVCRVYSDGKQQFDTVVIHSNNSDSFHDPKVCFQSQGSELLDQRVRTVTTKTRGKIPVTFIKTSYNGAERMAAYTYNGPSGFKSEPVPLLNDMFWGELMKGTIQTGTFYRFIALNPSTTEADLEKYIGQFLDNSYEHSKQVF